MRGGHAKSGPVAFGAPQRAVRGTRTRARHRLKGVAGTLVLACEAPPHLTDDEASGWRYYAPLLAGSGRLTLEARDTLAKYCTALATVQRLKAQMAAADYQDVMITPGGLKPNPLLLQLRQWLLVARAYETDLLLSPAAAVRSPKPEHREMDPDDAELDAVLN